MTRFFQQLFLQLHFWSQAQTLYKIHSPFVFQLALNCLENTQIPADLIAIEKLRQRWMRSKTQFYFEDLGTGKPRWITIGKCAQQMSIPLFYGHFLFHLIQYLKPRTILELGTNLGISTLYCAFAAPKANITTVEGDYILTTIAKANFQKMNVDKRIQIIHSDFTTFLKQNRSSFDFIFLDGHHDGKATYRYALQLFTFLTPQGVLLIDDIHWSCAMFKTFHRLSQKAQVAIRFDRMGLLFPKRAQAKQTFILRPTLPALVKKWLKVKRTTDKLRS